MLGNAMSFLDLAEFHGASDGNVELAADHVSQQADEGAAHRAEP